MGKKLSLALLIAAALMCAPACAGELGLGNRLRVTGRGTLSYRWESDSGQPAGWGLLSDDSLYDSTGLRQQTDFLLSGDILPGLRLDANIVRDPFSGSASRWTLTGGLGDASLALGDITASLDGNPFVSLRRSLRGLRIESPLGGSGSLVMITSQAKAPVRTDTFYGRNTSGPYYLNGSPVVDASERVDLDGRRLVRGQDYFMDYEIGAIWFQAALIVPPTSRVSVTYEHLAAGNAGAITAVRATQSHGRLRIGATYAAMRSAPAPSSAPKRDRWTGAGTIGPFFLSYRPVVPGSERVTINGIEQARDADYRIDYNEGRLIFAFPVPTGTLIEATYRTQAQGRSSGPESLFGMDGMWQISPRASLEASVASSAAPTGGSAGAIALSANASWDKFTIQGSLRRASPNFLGLDGAERIDSERRLTLELRPTSFVKASWLMSATTQPYLGVFGAQQSPLMAERNQDLRIEISPRGWPSLTFARTSRSARALAAEATGSTSREENSSDTVSLAYARKVFGASASLTDTRASANWFGLQQSDDFLPLSYNTADRAARFNIWLRPSDRLNLSFDAGRSRTRAGSGQDSAATGQRVSVSYQPSRTVSLSLSEVNQNTGGMEALSLPASSSKMTLFSMQYTPSAKFSASLTADRQAFTGQASTNSNSSSVSLGFGIRPSATASLDLQLTRQQVTSLGAGGRSSNNMVTFNTRLGPWRRMTAELGLQRLNGMATGSFLGFGPGAQQSLTTQGGTAAMLPYALSATASWRARLAYSMGKRHSVFVEGERWLSTGQPAAGRSESAAAGWDYRLAQGTKLCATLRSMRYRDPAEPRRNWSSNSFDVSVGFDF